MAEATKELKQESNSSQNNKAGEIRGFVSGSFAELKKVHWPNKNQVITYTSVVLVVVVIVAALIFVMDIGLEKLLELFLK